MSVQARRVRLAAAQSTREERARRLVDLSRRRSRLTRNHHGVPYPPPWVPLPPLPPHPIYGPLSRISKPITCATAFNTVCPSLPLPSLLPVVPVLAGTPSRPPVLYHPWGPTPSSALHLPFPHPLNGWRTPSTFSYPGTRPTAPTLAMSAAGSGAAGAPAARAPAAAAWVNEARANVALL